MPVKITSGYSLYRLVSLSTKNYTATARFRAADQINVAVRPNPQLPELVEKIIEHMPLELGKFAFRFLGDLPLPFLLILLAQIVGYEYWQTYVPHIQTPAQAAATPLFWFIIFAAQISFIGGFSLYTYLWIAPWHAAEHMAAHAYAQHRSTDYSCICTMNRVHPKCGTRLFTPAALLLWVISVLTTHYPEYALFVWLVGFELFFQLMKRPGYENIPGFSHASNWLQKYFSTRPAGPREIKTAQHALRALIQAETREQP